jgi:S-disulfanyl-L-cysteine oxidoreductase SoxD
MSRFRNFAQAGAAALAAAVILGGPAPEGATAQPKKPEEVRKSGLGREAHGAELKAWDIDVRPDGRGLPPGRGSVKDGEDLYQAQCASCHGEFGEGVGRWPVLAGGRGSLKNEGPEKTVGSYWPYASTLFDYIYVLYLNDVVAEDFTLSPETFTRVKMPNENGFYPDDRESMEKHFWGKEPCMKDCKPGPAKVISRARMLDVTPDTKSAPKVE